MSYNVRLRYLGHDLKGMPHTHFLRWQIYWALLSKYKLWVVTDAVRCYWSRWYWSRKFSTWNLEHHSSAPATLLNCNLGPVAKACNIVKILDKTNIRIMTHGEDFLQWTVTESTIRPGGPERGQILVLEFRDSKRASVFVFNFPVTAALGGRYGFHEVTIGPPDSATAPISQPWTQYLMQVGVERS